MPGPGFPPPRGGRGSRGPMGGPRGRFGPMMGSMAHYYFRPTRPAPGGYVATGGDRLTDTIVDMQCETEFTFRHAMRRNGILGGFACGIRKLTSGGLRHNSFVSKISLCDKLLAEGRITKEQCLRRKMEAAKKYNRYLLKCGYYNVYDYQDAMEDFAKSIGVNYVDDVHTPENERGRSR